MPVCSPATQITLGKAIALWLVGRRASGSSQVNLFREPHDPNAVSSLRQLSLLR